MSALLMGYAAAAAEATDIYDGKDAKEIIDLLGLGTDLKSAVDAGDATSYTSGETWTDLSGNALDFFRGADGSPGTDGPGFNGSAGGLSSSEYFTFDGNQYFTKDASNGTFVNSIHQDNATFTLAEIVYLAAGQNALAGTCGDPDTTIGFTWHVTTGSGMQFSVRKNGVVFNKVSSTAVSSSGWRFLCISYSEVAGSGHFRINGSTNTISGNYSAPSASSATNTLTLGRTEAGAKIMANGSRMAVSMMWNRALSTTETGQLYSAFGGRFGW